MAKKVRLDAWLVARGLASSRPQAQELIKTGQVLVFGVPVQTISAQIDVDVDVRLKDSTVGWVGRGAYKLAGVLGPLGVDPTGCVCADLGASTGGLTEVLLRAGASKVYAIDVGRGLLHERLREDPRVVSIEETNVRHLQALPEPIHLLTADLSFISLIRVLPSVRGVLTSGGQALVLVKPQFEVGPEWVEAGGVVRDAAVRAEAIEKIARAAVDLGFFVRGAIDSPLPGARSGNVEHFLHLVLH